MNIHFIVILTRKSMRSSDLDCGLQYCYFSRFVWPDACGIVSSKENLVECSVCRVSYVSFGTTRRVGLKILLVLYYPQTSFPRLIPIRVTPVPSRNVIVYRLMSKTLSASILQIRNSKTIKMMNRRGQVAWFKKYFQISFVKIKEPAQYPCPSFNISQWIQIFFIMQSLRNCLKAKKVRMQYAVIAIFFFFTLLKTILKMKINCFTVNNIYIYN